LEKVIDIQMHQAIEFGKDEIRMYFTCFQVVLGHLVASADLVPTLLKGLIAHYRCCCWLLATAAIFAFSSAQICADDEWPRAERPANPALDPITSIQAVVQR
jgi:hypothetical protein